MYLKDLQIGNVKLENNILLAPMAGITDLAFRKVCKDFGASLVCTEMISSKAILYDDSKTNFGGNPPYSPGNSTGYFGLITVRKRKASRATAIVTQISCLVVNGPISFAL